MSSLKPQTKNGWWLEGGKKTELNCGLGDVTKGSFAEMHALTQLSWDVEPAGVVTDGCFPSTDNTVTHNTGWGLSHCGTFKLTDGMKHSRQVFFFCFIFITVDSFRACVCVWCWGADPSFCLSGLSAPLKQQRARGPAALGCWTASKAKTHVVLLSVSCLKHVLRNCCYRS